MKPPWSYCMEFKDHIVPPEYEAFAERAADEPFIQAALERHKANQRKDTT